VKGIGIDRILDWNINEYLFTGLSQGRYSILITAYDKAGNQNTTFVEFVIDRTHPNILKFGPTGNDVDVDSEIWVDVSEIVQLGTLIFNVNGVPGVTEVSGSRLIFDPYQLLEYGMEYTVIFQMNDLAGNRIPRFTWSFRTLDMGYVIGKVVDDSGDPIEGAKVQIKDYGTTITNDEGMFYINVPPGMYTVIIIMDGYEELSREVRIESGATTDLEDLKIKESGGDSPILVLIAAIGAVLIILILAFSIFIRKRRRRNSGEEFYVLEGASTDEDPIEGEDEDFEIEYFDGTQNYYQLLGVEDNATQLEIKKAYRKLAAMYHPDRMAARGEEMELDEVADLIRDINDAKTVLLDPLRRQMYDMSLLDREM
jgi:hypothetical protein